MKNILTKQNLVFAGVGLITAFVIYKIVANRKKNNVVISINKDVLKTYPIKEKSSDFCGCGG